MTDETDRLWPWLLLALAVAGLGFGLSALTSLTDNPVAGAIGWTAWFLFVLCGAASIMMTLLSVSILRVADQAWTGLRKARAG